MYPPLVSSDFIMASNITNVCLILFQDNIQFKLDKTPWQQIFITSIFKLKHTVFLWNLSCFIPFFYCKYGKGQNNITLYYIT